MAKGILDIGNGEIIDALNRELERVILNINDINTDAKPRTITLKITLKPAEDKKLINVSSFATSTVRPCRKVEVTMVNIKEQKKTGDVEFKLQEVLADAAPGQIDFDGNVVQAPKPIVVGVIAHNPVEKVG